MAFTQNLANEFINTYPNRAGTEGLAEYFKTTTNRSMNTRERREIVRMVRHLRKASVDSPLDKLANIVTECFDYKSSEIQALQKQLAELETQVDFAESAAANWGQQVAAYSDTQLLLLKNIDHLEDQLDRKIQSSRDCSNLVIVMVYVIAIGFATFIGIMNMNGDFTDSSA